jgi:RNA polymerase sigma factor (sigma-70 family)
MNPPSEELINQCRKGHEKAIRQLYERCFPDMYKVVVRYGRHQEDVQEMVDNSFMKILKALSSYQDIEKFGHWVRTVSINAALDFVRSRQRREKWLSDAPLENVGQMHLADPSWTPPLATQDIWKHMAELPDQHRVILNLFAIEGYAHKEIAQMLEISETASRWYVSEARKQLKKNMNKGLHND